MTEKTGHKAIAIVAVSAILPDAPDAATFWRNIKDGRYSISDVDPERWDPELYYDADRSAPEKTYSRIGGWVRDWAWEPMKWKLPIPPTVAAAMDDAQKWGVACTRSLLLDYGYPERPLDTERTAVILGNAMAGENHYRTALRIQYPEFATSLQETSSFGALPQDVREAIELELAESFADRLPQTSEDTMPGELANCLAGRIANLFNLRGPNFVCDAACASALAAIDAASEGLVENEFDSVITGGIDRNMGPTTFVKFSKIGALSATGTRPYADGADGFVMGEGAALFMLKRLADAERDGDKIYAVLRGVAGSSDGKGKGITAPNPVGQKLAVERAWRAAGVPLESVGLIEGHGTSTKVGDLVEVQTLIEVLGGFDLAPGSVALGSVKSNIGHLKGAAGAAGLLKTVLALHERVLPPSVNFDKPNPNIDFAGSALAVNTELRPWEASKGNPRRAGISAFGFGGTNFHAVVEEYIPGNIDTRPSKTVAVSRAGSNGNAVEAKPLRGAVLLGAPDVAGLVKRLESVAKDAEAGRAPEPDLPARQDLDAVERIAIDYGDASELAAKVAKALTAMERDIPAMWKALRAQGVFRGRGAAPKVAFLYPGQGSQYAGMLGDLRGRSRVVADVIEEADRTMEPLIGKPLSTILYDAEAERAEEALKQTEITQPAVLTVDTALTRLLADFGMEPDMVMGHSLGEYGALVASRALSFTQALEAVSARGRGMADVSMEDNGLMAAVFAPLDEVEATLAKIDGYVVVANINSKSQSVVGGATAAVERAIAAFEAADYTAVRLPVSHAFHTTIVADASEPLREVLQRLDLRAPAIPLVANVHGEFYPTGADVVPQMVELLARQVASPVQFIRGAETLYASGARLFVEVGPKKALHGFIEDIFAGRDDVVALFTNHPKVGDVASFNQALCGMWAAGLGISREAAQAVSGSSQSVRAVATSTSPQPDSAVSTASVSSDQYTALGQLLADTIRKGQQIIGSGARPPVNARVMVSGAAVGLPGAKRVFEDDNVSRLLHGNQMLDVIPMRNRKSILDKHITRLVKSDGGEPVFEHIDDVADVIKLAGRAGSLDLHAEFGVSAERIEALDIVTQLAIGAGIDALRDAGIPLVMRYRTTTKGTKLPDGWGLPDSMRDETGVLFASAFPGMDSLIDETDRYHRDRSRREQIEVLRHVREHVDAGSQNALHEIDSRIHELEHELEESPYLFDRRFLFRVLSMAHAQFAELIGARGPNTQLNSACASTTQAFAIAEDWIRAGRCRRVIIIAADDVTTDSILQWVGAGFLSTGAAATDEVIEEAALPFDRRRHGMLLGMGAAAIVVEGSDALSERGLEPICEVLGEVTANSAFHGTRLDVAHICSVMERLVSEVEARTGLDRADIASRMVFISHETYTPARGGSAAAEVEALRAVFGDAAAEIVIANSKGFTGHPMGVGIEDVLAIKSLETGLVPPVVNYREPDPELGTLNLSKGGYYPVEFALRLGAGFGSQISMTLMRRGTVGEERPNPDELGFEYRVGDRESWTQWLRRSGLQDAPELEVVKRTLRIVDAGPPTQTIEEFAEPAKRPIAQPPTAVAAAPQPEVAPAQTQPPPQAAAPAASKGSDVLNQILEIVTQQTGYPADMLDPDLDLEADLGIDTVKQAELFASIREHYQIPREEKLQLRDFPTLRDVAGFVRDRRPDLGAAAGTATSAPPETVPPVAAEATAETGDAVLAQILELVTKQTGYPADMLDPELDLEADLGIDTVKQAELFAAIREHYGIARQEKLQLRDFPTLEHVAGFVRDNRPDLAAGSAPGAQAASAPQPAAPAADAEAGGGTVLDTILEIVTEQTGYPADMLDPELDLEADLGIDTVKQAELFAKIRENYEIPRQENLQLRDFPTLQHVAQFVLDHRPDLAAPASTAGAAGSDRPEPSSPAAAPASPAPSGGEVADQVLAAVLEIVTAQTGYPEDMLESDLDLEADLGIDTVKQAELFANVREHYGIPRDDNLQLRDFPTLRHVVGFVLARRPDLGGSAAVAPQSSPSQAPAPETSTAGQDDVLATVLSLVADKTGYPADMLDPDLDLEADLGIDTVKQAELFASIRENYGIPRQENLQLRDYPTLRHVVGFVRDHRADLSDTGTNRSESAENTVAEQHDEGLAKDFARRVPVPVLRPSLESCKKTGIELGAGSRVIVMRDRGGVGAALLRRLEKLSVEVLDLSLPISGPDLEAKVAEWRSAGATDGIFWLPALDFEPQTLEMDLAQWRQELEGRVKLLYLVARAVHEEFEQAGRFLIAATRMGGQLGYGQEPASAPMGGAVSGFVKAFRRERPASLAKVVDFPASRKTSDLADRLLEESARDPGVVEVGHLEGQRWSVALIQQSAEDGGPGMDLDSNSVVVVTGAAGSITSAITADLAGASGGVFYLLDLVDTPDRSNPDLERLDRDRDGLKREIFARLKTAGERATPALVERELAKIERARAVVAAIQAVESAGGTAHYLQADLTQADSVERAVATIRENHDCVDVLLHAAGMEVSHFLPDKKPQEFDRIFDVKADGWFNVRRSLGDMRLRATVAFSSIAGRFGNGGQTDYSAANDLLCKHASALRAETRAIAVDWTAWADIGMASRGSIPQMMDAAGIDMLPPSIGIPFIRRELTAGARRGEVLVAGRLGVLLEEWDATGGVELSSLTEAAAEMPMVGSVVGAGVLSGIEIETPLDPNQHAFLYDHKIDRTAVLPGVMGIETFAEAARLLAPGEGPLVVRDVRFLAPFKFYRDQERALSVHALPIGGVEGAEARCRLLGRRTLPNGDIQETEHFVASVTPGTSIEAPEGRPPSGAGNGSAGAEDIYRVYFHGPAYQVLDQVWRDASSLVGRMATDLPAALSQGGDRLQAAPRLVELCFQTAGVWEIGTRGRMGLPHAIDRLEIFAQETQGPVFAIVSQGEEGFDAKVVDESGVVLVRMTGYRTIELPNALDESSLEPLRRATDGLGA